MRLDMTSSSFLLVESRFPRPPPALCFRAPFRFSFFCWCCSSALIESSSSSNTVSSTTYWYHTRQMTKKEEKVGGNFVGFFANAFETKRNKKKNQQHDELTHMCWALLFLFFFSQYFFPFSSVKKDEAHSQKL